MLTMSQDVGNIPTPEDLQALDTETQSLRTETSLAKETLKQLKVELSNISSELTIKQLRESIDELETEKRHLLSRLEPLRSGVVRCVSKEEREAVTSSLTYWEKCADRRRKIVKEIWAVIAEGMGNTDEVDLDALKVNWN